jgi:hypothetical protein
MNQTYIALNCLKAILANDKTVGLTSLKKVR